jgi:hypothetical protein
MKSTSILTTAQAFAAYKDTNNLRNTLTAEANIVEVSGITIMVTKTLCKLFMKQVNGVVRIVEGIFEPYYKLLAMNNENDTAFFSNAAKGLKTCL